MAEPGLYQYRKVQVLGDIKFQEDFGGYKFQQDLGDMKFQQDFGEYEKSRRRDVAPLRLSAKRLETLKVLRDPTAWPGTVSPGQQNSR